MASTNINIKIKRSKLSLKNKRQLLQDISPAPVPRSSHRIRTLSTESDDKIKVNLLSRRNHGLASSLQINNEQDNKNSKNEVENNSYNGLDSFGRVSGICPLANLGNTCFLNSVLYALRFLPGFIHDLHHLYIYSKSIIVQKDDASLASRQKFLEELHDLFTLLKREEKSTTDTKRVPALHPMKFLESVRTVNPVFEGNRQQDAHELVHCLLDQLFNLPQDLIKYIDSDDEGKPPKNKKRRRGPNSNNKLEPIKKGVALDLVGSKFVGQMMLETRCCECEKTNGRKEDFLEVCVPVKTKAEADVDVDEDEISDTDMLLTALCNEDGLCGTNKYWCDFCSHHNEAERFVHFESLPHNLLIHVKRFSSNTRTSATKCCDAMPAPFELPCFCHECRLKQLHSNKNVSKDTSDSHLPYFLRSFVCHLGATISSGHYISFVHISPKSWSSCADSTKDKVGCSFLNCCASHLDRIVPPSGIFNGRSYDHQAVRDIWLECDDDKIKVVSSSDVSDAMKSNNLTPYLLFYSR